ncbi:bZIP transcription factor 44-like [Rhodamnia argentea]|uniref:BZIP transcription factor 44-like n=1 Tax=Rhodamnia argentea TaxID=178133 RepID=A0A8B8MRN3_9MYRT|nr:bZIP transcription factor 44-like [Rhodamnia argentea]
MASPSRTSSGSSLVQNSASEEELRVVVDQRKRKRMISNRESARRSRMRKQKHLDDLRAQVAQLSEENHQIGTNINITTQHYSGIQAENSVLRAQVGELSNRLESLNEIINFLNTSNGVFGSGVAYSGPMEPVDEFLNLNPFGLGYSNQAIMASSEMFQC